MSLPVVGDANGGPALRPAAVAPPPCGRVGGCASSPRSLPDSALSLLTRGCSVRPSLEARFPHGVYWSKSKTMHLAERWLERLDAQASGMLECSHGEPRRLVGSSLEVPSSPLI